MFQHIDPTRGGIENTAFYLYRELGKKYEMQGASMTVAEDIVCNGVEYFPEEDAGLKFFVERNQWQLNHSIDSENTVNLCMTWFNAIGAYIAKKRYGTPYICLVHGDDVYLQCNAGNVRKRLERKLKALIAPKILGTADVLCINSKNTQRILHQTVENTNEIIIHPGIHFEEIDTSWNKKNEFVILSIGRLVERKGFRNVLKALPAIKKVIPNIRYIMAGDGPLIFEFKQLVKKLDLEDCVEFPGRVSEEEKMRLLEESDIVIMPSFEIQGDGSVEGFGIIFVEANMAGRYVVGTLSGGIPDAIQEGVTGHLLKDEKPETIANDICEIYKKLDDLYVKELIDERVEWAKKHSFENIAKQYEQVMFEYSSDLKFW